MDIFGYITGVTNINTLNILLNSTEILKEIKRGQASGIAICEEVDSTIYPEKYENEKVTFNRKIKGKQSLRKIPLIHVNHAYLISIDENELEDFDHRLCTIRRYYNDLIDESRDISEAIFQGVKLVFDERFSDTAWSSLINLNESTQADKLAKFISELDTPDAFVLTALGDDDTAYAFEDSEIMTLIPGIFGVLIGSKRGHLTGKDTWFIPITRYFLLPLTLKTLHYLNKYQHKSSDWYINRGRLSKTSKEENLEAITPSFITNQTLPDYVTEKASAQDDGTLVVKNSKKGHDELISKYEMTYGLRLAVPRQLPAMSGGSEKIYYVSRADHEMIDLRIDQLFDHFFTKERDVILSFTSQHNDKVNRIENRFSIILYEKDNSDNKDVISPKMIFARVYTVDDDFGISTQNLISEYNEPINISGLDEAGLIKVLMGIPDTVNTSQVPSDIYDSLDALQIPMILLPLPANVKSYRARQMYKSNSGFLFDVRTALNCLNAISHPVSTPSTNSRKVSGYLQTLKKYFSNLIENHKVHSVGLDTLVNLRGIDDDFTFVAVDRVVFPDPETCSPIDDVMINYLTIHIIPRSLIHKDYEMKQPDHDGSIMKLEP
jgi:hypothetical protein